ncbi:hypothetical protein HDE_02258 [Halotydeus destructor]|nr:hypothetical protein HDE_02258 [Halotydeus destructor]
MYIKFLYVYVNDRKHPQLAYKYGDIFEYFGGGKLIYTISTAIISAPPILMAATTWKFARNVNNEASIQELIAILKVLSGSAKPATLGLTSKDRDTLLHTVKLLYPVGHSFYSLVVLGFGLIPAVRRYLHDNLSQYGVNFIFFLVCWLIYCFVLVYSQITLLAYFYVSCKVVTLRIHYLETRIVDGIKQVTQDYHIIQEHSAIMRSTKELNHYWRYFMLILLSSYIPLIVILLYMSLVSDNFFYVKMAVYATLA